MLAMQYTSIQTVQSFLSTFLVDTSTLVIFFRSALDLQIRISPKNKSDVIQMIMIVRSYLSHQIRQLGLVQASMTGHP